jgi:hypothetical protein
MIQCCASIFLLSPTCHDFCLCWYPSSDVFIFITAVQQLLPEIYILLLIIKYISQSCLYCLARLFNFYINLEVQCSPIMQFWLHPVAKMFRDVMYVVSSDISLGVKVLNIWQYIVIFSAGQHYLNILKNMDSNISFHYSFTLCLCYHISYSFILDVNYWSLDWTDWCLPTLAKPVAL